MKPQELKNKIRKIAETEGFIDGIYNYCDRWCERCYLTSKCRQFALEAETPVVNDPTNKEFWNYMHTVFETTHLLLEEDMKKMGIDLSESSNITTEKDLDTLEQPLYKKASDLAMQVSGWLSRKHDLLENNAEIIQLIDQKLCVKFADTIEVIQWYNFFIAAKIFRALPHTVSDIESEHTVYDSNGSAKIALIAITRSIAAWGFLLEHMPEEQDDILSFLRELSELKQATEKQFPDAYAFVRPGFDEY